jgi:hypothetical protein
MDSEDPEGYLRPTPTPSPAPNDMNLTRGMAWAALATATSASAFMDSSLFAVILTSILSFAFALTGAVNAPSDTQVRRDKAWRAAAGVVLIVSVVCLLAWPWAANAVVFGGDTDIELECRRAVAGSFAHRGFLPPRLLCEFPAGSGVVTSVTPTSTSMSLGGALLASLACGVAAAATLSRRRLSS